MKLNIFIDVVKDAINEVKENWGLMKATEPIKEKGKYFSLVYFNILFLFVYLVPIGYFFYLLAVSFLVGPVIIFGLVVCISFIFFIIFMKTKAYPAMKENYLKK